MQVRKKLLEHWLLPVNFGDFNTFLTNVPISYSLKTGSSHWRYSVRKDVLKIFAKFTEKHLCRSPFFNKVAGLKPATLLKKRLWHLCFPVNLAKFLRTSFLQNTSGRLLLENTRKQFAFSCFQETWNDKIGRNWVR